MSEPQDSSTRHRTQVECSDKLKAAMSGEAVGLVVNETDKRVNEAVAATTRLTMSTHMIEGLPSVKP
jgi:hypothetical protein